MLIKKKSIPNILNLIDNKIFFKANHVWKICFDADEESRNTYSLKLNYLNFLKFFNIDKKYFSNFDSIKIDFLKIAYNENKDIKKLRYYQKLDVEKLGKINSVAVFNEMRTGKTPTSLILTSKWSVSNLLIIIPGILQQQWRLSIEEWLNRPSYVISQLAKSDRELFYEKFCSQKNIILIISKDVFKSDNVYFNNLREKYIPKFVDFCSIIDESHYLRNYNSQQSKSIYTLSDSKYKIVLTGTPIVNNYSDIFGTLKFIKPSKYSSYWKFVGKFFEIKLSEIVVNGKKIIIKNVNGFKSKNLEFELKNEIASFSVSRKQKDVLPWLPKIIRQKEILIMDKNQQNLYDEVIKKKNYTIELLSNLKSVLLYPKYLIPKIKTNGIKINYLLSFCKDNEERQILIFSTRSKTFLEPLANILFENNIKFGIITGNTNKEKREFYINKFQNSELKLLLCNIQSTGFGLNLNNADTIIFADRSYSPADNQQAESRFLPVDNSLQLKVKYIIDLVCKNTIDERILRLLDKKKYITKIINTSPNLIFEDV